MSPIFVHEKHDIGIIRTDATKVGLMLATIDGKPAYRTSTERYLKNQYYAGAPDYGALDPQSELPIILDDWRSGFGLEVADSADPLRYYSSIGMDARHRGMLIAGWTPTAVAITSAVVATPPLLNGNMEAGTVNWSGTCTASTVAHAGTAGLRMENNAIAYQDLDGYALGAEYTFTAWLLNVGGGQKSRIGLSDGASTSYTSYTEYAAWTEVSIAHTMSTSATMCRVIMQAGTGTDDVNVDDASIAPTTPYTISGAPTAFANFNDNFYIAVDKYLVRCNSAGDGVILNGELPATITDLEPFADDNMYIACGTAQNYYYASTAEVLTLSTAGTATYQFFATVHGATPTLWGNDGVNTIRSTVDPLNAGTAWSGTTTVGSSYHNITDLISWKGLLYIMKEDKPFYLDATPAVQDDLARELESEYSTTSGKNAWVWQNELHIPCGAQALLHTDGTTNTFINPSKWCTNLTDFAGRVYAGAGDGEWNYVIIENASTTEVEVMATRLETIGGVTSRVWHPIAEITLKGCNACHISNEVRRALWIASDDATDSLYYLTLPTSYGDIINDPNRTFLIDSPCLITSGQHGGFKGENKYWRKATATLGHTYNTDRYFELHFMRLGDGDYSDPADGGWVDAGDFKGSTASMTQSLYFPANTEGVSPVTPMMWFKLVAKTNANALTPMLLNLDIRAILKPPARKMIECAVRCADKILDKDGQYIEGTSAADIRTVLDEARDSTTPFTFYDPWGTSHTCIMLPNEPESTFVTDLKNENPEQLYYLRMQEVVIA